MPYAFEARKVNLLPHADKRIKLTAEDRANIRAFYKDGLAIRAIARKYKDKCSRRLIQFIVFPWKLEEAARQFAVRQKDGRYYQRKRHTRYIREHRRRKAKILGAMKTANGGKPCT